MRIVAFLRSLWLGVARRARAERALDEEIRAYVDLLAGEYEHAGMTPGSARRRALVETGGIEQVKEATRDAWVGEGIATVARELRFTLRGLRNAPVFFVIAVSVLAIGIGGATAIFTVIKGSLLRPLPAVSHPEELVSLEPTKGEKLLYDFSYLDYRDLREQTRSLAGLGGYDGTYMRLDDRVGPERSSWVSYVTGRTAADAQRELSLLAARLAGTYEVNEGHGIRVYSGAGMTVDERTALAKLPRLLAVVVGLLLLIACANVANLSLVRASARRRELATRGSM